MGDLLPGLDRDQIHYSDDFSIILFAVTTTAATTTTTSTTTTTAGNRGEGMQGDCYFLFFSNYISILYCYATHFLNITKWLTVSCQSLNHEDSNVIHIFS